jgi:hypothetical protein
MGQLLCNPLMNLDILPLAITMMVGPGIMADIV